MAPARILAVEKQDKVRQLRPSPAFADRFLARMLTRNIRIEEDLIDQLFNTSEKRLARIAAAARVTASQRRLIARFRGDLRSSWQRWLARRARVSTSS